MISLRPRHAALALVPALLAAWGLLAACSSEVAHERQRQGYYLSIGDSYAAGYRPADDGPHGENTTDGFAWKVADEADLTLVNYSCTGITARSYVDGEPCVEHARPPGAPESGGGSEAESVMEFLDEHGDEVRLVTVVLGGNDFQHCATERRWRQCAEDEMAAAAGAIDVLLTGVEDRIGDDVPVIGLTYPNVLLGEDVRGQPDAAKIDAAISVFRDVVNPALAGVYSSHDATFVDVTDEFDGYEPPTKTVDTDEYGTIPLRAATICDLTYFCSRNDVHLTPQGHDRLARLVLDARPS